MLRTERKRRRNEMSANFQLTYLPTRTENCDWSDSRMLPAKPKTMLNDLVLCFVVAAVVLFIPCCFHSTLWLLQLKLLTDNVRYYFPIPTQKHADIASQKYNQSEKIDKTHNMLLKWSKYINLVMYSFSWWENGELLFSSFFSLSNFDASVFAVCQPPGWLYCVRLCCVYFGCGSVVSLKLREYIRKIDFNYIVRIVKSIR